MNQQAAAKGRLTSTGIFPPFFFTRFSAYLVVSWIACIDVEAPVSYDGSTTLCFPATGILSALADFPTAPIARCTPEEAVPSS